MPMPTVAGVRLPNDRSKYAEGFEGLVRHNPATRMCPPSRDPAISNSPLGIESAVPALNPSALDTSSGTIAQGRSVHAGTRLGGSVGEARSRSSRIQIFRSSF